MRRALRFLTDPLLAGVTVVVVQADEFRHRPEVAAVLASERSVRLAQGPLQPTGAGGVVEVQRRLLPQEYSLSESCSHLGGNSLQKQAV